MKYTSGGKQAPDKRHKALGALLARIPQNDLKRIPSNLYVLAEPDTVSGATTFVKSDKTLIYLSPLLEHLNQDVVNSVVAHEFAHAILHKGRNPSEKYEQEAQELIQKWGFAPAPRTLNDAMFGETENATPRNR